MRGSKRSEIEAVLPTAMIDFEISSLSLHAHDSEFFKSADYAGQAAANWLAASRDSEKTAGRRAPGHSTAHAGAGTGPEGTVTNFKITVQLERRARRRGAARPGAGGRTSTQAQAGSVSHSAGGVNSV